MPSLTLLTAITAKSRCFFEEWATLYGQAADLSIQQQEDQWVIGFDFAGPAAIDLPAAFRYPHLSFSVDEADRGRDRGCTWHGVKHFLDP
jgi:hypothetical protein